MTVVFPFENLGPPEGAYFAAGMSEEITSRVRITPQLIRTSDDTHIWSQTYDREIDDIFEVQTDIATRVIEQLDVTLLGSEREVVENVPTTNPEAYKLYLQARGMNLNYGLNTDNIEERVELLQKATELDPDFVEAWAELSLHHSLLYKTLDQTDTRLSLAQTALQKARASDPDNYRTHMAQGLYYYGFSDYDRARDEFVAAANPVPNDAEPREFLGYIYRRQGRLAEAIEAMESAIEMNPQDANLASNLGTSYAAMREFDKAIEFAMRAQRINPEVYLYVWLQVECLIRWKGDLEGARKLLADNPAEGDFVYHLGSAILSLYSDEPDEALEHARRIPEDTGEFFTVARLHTLARVLDKHPTKTAEARQALEEASAVMEKLLETAPGNAVVRQWYAYMLACRGLESAAVREAKLAVDLTAKDKFDGPGSLEGLAAVYARVGRHDEAIDLIERLLNTNYSSPMTYHTLQLETFWDPLRENPRFLALLKENT